MASNYTYAEENMLQGANTGIPSSLRPDKMLNDDLMHSVGLYSQKDIEEAKFKKFSRFGRVLDPYGKLNDCREYLFFTKPDLHICVQGGLTQIQDSSGVYNISGKSAYNSDTSLAFQKNGLIMNPQLAGNAYFRYLIDTHPDVVKMLEYGLDTTNPFCNILSSSVSSYLGFGGSEASTIDNPSTIFGTSYEYLKDSEASDENPSFSLEFVDSKYLDVYHFFKAYSEYHIVRKSGLVTPPTMYYYREKKLHNTMGVYKFIVHEDMETLLYWAYIWGVYPVTCPRDSFADPLFSDGLTFPIDFKGAFIEDMNPAIIYQFNQLMYPRIKNVNNWLHTTKQNYEPLYKYTDFSTKAAASGTNSGYQADLGGSSSDFSLGGSSYKKVMSDMIDGTLPTAAFIEECRPSTTSINGSSSINKNIYKLRWYA